MNVMPYQRDMKERRVLVKCESETNLSFGKDPLDRSVKELLKSCVINVNKPKGPTSHEVSDFVKQIIKVKKAGQSGTLDPAVTGVLPVGVGKATRSLLALLKAGKEYVCLMHVHKEIPEDKLREVISSFVGVVKQMPPIKSAVVRKLRDRKVYYIDIIEIRGKEVLFRVGCQAGTYIRVLCHDIGKKLGCGAHMAQLLRTRVGIFDDSDMINLQEIEDAYANYKETGSEEELKKVLRPIEDVVAHLPKIWVHDSAVWYLCNGGYLAVPGISKLTSDVADGLVGVFTLKDEFIGMGTARMSAKKIMTEEKGIAIQLDAVLMEQGIYPKIINKVEGD